MIPEPLPPRGWDGAFEDRTGNTNENWWWRKVHREVKLWRSALPGGVAQPGTLEGDHSIWH